MSNFFHIFYTLITIQAQEKQNDATWEETVEFLEKNIHYISDEPSVQFQINENKLIKNWADEIWTFDLNDLRKVYLSEKKFNINGKFYGFKLEIYAYGKYVEYVNKRDNLNYLKNWILVQMYDYGDGLSIESDKHKNRLRVIKALKHLAYLANEKRPKSKF